jgi:membrane associated rhomboid family serine protease
MLPLGDDNRDRLRRPIVTTIVVALNVAVFVYELTLVDPGGRAVQAFVLKWGVVPIELSSGVDLAPHAPGPFWITMLTSMFLHGGWAHLLGNMLYLWIFGDNVEDRLGRVPFVIFYVVAGVAAVLAQTAVSPDSRVPMIGASGAISGVLGAYLVLFPHKRVRVLAFWFLFDVPALVVIGLWAATQFVYSYGSIVQRSLETERGGVAYMAHVGGFAAGLLAGLLWRLLATACRRGGSGPSAPSRPSSAAPSPRG